MAAGPKSDGGSSQGRINARVLIGLVATAIFALCQVAFLRTAVQSTHCNEADPGRFDYIALEAAALTDRRARWDSWPFGDEAQNGSSPIRVGIVTGGSSDLFGGGASAYADATSCLLRLFAEQHGYAFYAERALQRFGADRPVAWQKVRLLLDRLHDVDLIVWIDADIAWTEPDVDLAEMFLQRLSTRSTCVGNLGQPRWDDVAGAVAPEGGTESVDGFFLWASADVRPRQERNMNLNSAVMALRSGMRAQRFLEAVWAEGDDPLSYRRHNPGWRKQPPGHHYWGWPFEQGAVWAVLDRDHEMLRRTCVTSVGTLHSVQYHRWKQGSTLGAHMPGMPSEDRRKAACHHLASALVAPGRCGRALRQCPDLFSGRLVAAHADGLCAHCLGPGAIEISADGAQSVGHAASPAENTSVADWSHFDCSCLQTT
jgi:hypothetical protein